MNQLSKIEPHSKRLEDAADRMIKDGVGTHATRGHAAMLRRMAGEMRAAAARGRIPYESSTAGMFASSDGTKTTPMRGRPTVTVNELLQERGDDAIVRRLNKVTHQARRLGFDIPADRFIDVHELDQAISGRGDRIEKMALKANLAALRLI
jgi:hypothetical protein